MKEVKNSYSNIPDLVHLHSQVENILQEKNCSFSPSSLKNISLGVAISEELRGKLSNDPLFIYGSTAKGTAGLEPKIQEIQFWNQNNFWGSSFRIYGNSDVDIRCISCRPYEIFNAISDLKNKLSFQNTENITIKIEDYRDVWKNLKNLKSPSFYRRILLLNPQIVLDGYNDLFSLILSTKKYLTSKDKESEDEMIRAKVFVREELQKRHFIFLNSQELIQKYPTSYSAKNLAADIFHRGKVLKICFGQQESSVISVQVKSIEDIHRYNFYLNEMPGTSFREIKMNNFNDPLLPAL